MTEQVTDTEEMEYESLGSYFYGQREKKHLKIEDIEDDTKIPARILKAMEADDFASLPAEAFARGFYVLYAKSLGLDVDRILERYTQERGLPNKNMYAEVSSLQNEKPVDTLAARPMISPGSLLGFIFVMFIFIFAGICYYFSWNPATYFSDLLRSFQNKTSIETPENTDPPPIENTTLEKKKVSSATQQIKSQGAPLVVMSGDKISYYTRNGIVFLTVPPSDTLKY